MTYLDNGATSFHKPETVYRAVQCAMANCANPGRGGYTAAMAAAATVLRCREQAAELFCCQPEQVVMTANCTHGLNVAIETIVKPGARVVISGFEHNAVTRPLHARNARLKIAGQKLFDWGDTLESVECALKSGADAAVFTHVSNVFGYIMPIYEIGALCKQYRVPFVVDAAQSAGMLPIDLQRLGADFVAMPGHKGLLGPQGTGLLLCGRDPVPFIQGGTGSVSEDQNMPDFLPDMAEAGTLNVPGIAGLAAGMQHVKQQGVERIFAREKREAYRCGTALKKLGYHVFMGEKQGGTISFVPDIDCEDMARMLGEAGIAVRAGLHCAPLAHRSAGTEKTGTVRVSFGHDAAAWQTGNLLLAVENLQGRT